jgi:acyl carrier protein
MSARDTLDDRVRAVAERMRLVDATGELVPIDSLTLVEFVLQLEFELGVSIPSTALTVEQFRSLASLQRWIRDLAG